MTDKNPQNPQTFLNSEVHDWYRTVFGYSDHLVTGLLDEFDIQKKELVLDPFCGTGTTLVECMKLGINSVGIDANPSSYFAARVKTNWNITSDKLLELLATLKHKYYSFKRRVKKHKLDPTYKYLHDSGMIDRGWISPEPLRKALAVKTAIDHLPTNSTYKNFFILALLAEVVENISNVKFGPTLYCGPPKDDVEVITGFENRIQKIARDINSLKILDKGVANIYLGDARDCEKIFDNSYKGGFSAIISSPPYPTEHDYTRNSRLELAFLENVSDRESLQKIKKDMLRSNTKGIYVDDNDGRFIRGYSQINSIIGKIEPKAKNKNHGFARLYTTVIREYFGGMKRHLISVKPYLLPRAYCAYIVGDQSSYFQVHVPTAEILCIIAEDVGYEFVEIRHWRSRWASKSSREIDENILILQNK